MTRAQLPFETDSHPPPDRDRAEFVLAVTVVLGTMLRVDSIQITPPGMGWFVDELAPLLLANPIDVDEGLATVGGFG